MTEPPLPPLFTVTADLARQSTQSDILALLHDLSRRVDILMTEDAAVAATVARIEANTTATATALNSVQALLVALQAEVAAGNLSQATLDALSKADTDVAALRTQAEADAAADVPPA